MLGGSRAQVRFLQSRLQARDNQPAKSQAPIEDGVHKVRFQELRDVDGSPLVQGLHPVIAVVAADSTARAAAVSALEPSLDGKVLQAFDVEHQLQRAAANAVEEHAASVDEKQSRVADAEHAMAEATAEEQRTARDASIAVEDLTRFDDLASRLACAEEAYEASVRADSEAARSLAAALGELDRVLGQRQSANSSLDQARRARDNRGVPDAVIEQALSLQTALANAEAGKHEAVQQADEMSRAARAASREAKRALEDTHAALLSGMALISVGVPDWGPGVPLPGLVANYRDLLSAAVTTAQGAQVQAKGAQQEAESSLQQENRDLDALVAAGPPTLDPFETIDSWLASDAISGVDALLADDAFGRFSTEQASALVKSLAGRGCQVIYLTDDPEILGWAIGLPHETGGASTIPSAWARKPALVSD
jgi:hypothetical protein